MEFMVSTDEEKMILNRNLIVTEGNQLLFQAQQCIEASQPLISDHTRTPNAALKFKIAIQCFFFLIKVVNTTGFIETKGNVT
jgi:hypothetical protein